MTVFLTVLKIIGLVLLGILALVLFLLLLVLFVPVRYRVRAYKDDERFFGEARVTWLLHLVNFTGKFEKMKFTKFLRIACFKVIDDEAEEVKKSQESNNSKNKSDGIENGNSS